MYKYGYWLYEASFIKMIVFNWFFGVAGLSFGSPAFFMSD